jgi:hypothetical protein
MKIREVGLVGFLKYKGGVMRMVLVVDGKGGHS